VERDDEDQHPGERDDGRQELEHVPEPDPAEAEQDAGDGLPDHVRDEREAGERGEPEAEAGGEAAPDGDRRGSDGTGDDGDPERSQDEAAQVRRLLPPVRHGDAELAEEAREDRHRQHGEHERAAAVRVQEAALEHDEREGERRREAAEDERFDRVRPGGARACDLVGPDEVGRDGRRDVRRGRRTNRRRRTRVRPGSRESRRGGAHVSRGWRDRLPSRRRRWEWRRP
jgi:hypothetical protein